MEYVELAGVIVNVIGLAFVILQLREAQKSIHLQTTLQATNTIVRIDEILVEHPELAEVFATDETLSGSHDAVRRRAFSFLMLNYFATMFILRDKRHIRPDEWIPYENYFCDVMANPHFQRMWDEIRDEAWYYAPFETFVADTIQKGPRRARPAKGYSAYFDIKEIRDPDSRDFREAIHLYEAAFPDGEKEKPERIRAWLRGGGDIAPDRYHMVRLVDTSCGPVEGVMMFHYLADANIGFLGYIAVSPNKRNRGYGTFLMTTLKRMLEGDAREAGYEQPLGVFTELDVESNSNPSTFDRFRFWERHGVLPLDMHWEYPPLRDTAGPATMYLAFLPFSATPDTPLPARDAERAARAIYRGVYRLPTETSELTRILSSLSGRAHVERRRIRASVV